MDQPGVFQYRQAIEKLLCEDLDELSAETLELILLDEFVEIRREAFEYQTQVTLVRK